MGRNPRERVIVFAGGFLAIAALWQMTIFAPQTTRLASQQSEQQSLDSQIDQLEATITSLREAIDNVEDPDEAVRETIAALETDIEALTGGEPRRDLAFIALMPVPSAVDRIRSAIEAGQSLRIIGFDRQPGAGVPIEGEDNTAEIAVDHRKIRLVVEADYSQTMALLARLETLTVPLVWRSMNYEVTEHPMARVTLRFDIYAAARLN